MRQKGTAGARCLTAPPAYALYGLARAPLHCTIKRTAAEDYTSVVRVRPSILSSATLRAPMTGQKPPKTARRRPLGTAAGCRLRALCCPGAGLARKRRFKVGGLEGRRFKKGRHKMPAGNKAGGPPWSPAGPVGRGPNGPAGAPGGLPALYTAAVNRDSVTPRATARAPFTQGGESF